MKRILFVIALTALGFVSCKTNKQVSKSVAYSGIYKEKPLAILLMPPINRSTNVDAKEFFRSTLNVPLANNGYYVIPPFISMEILKKESAYDSELFLNSPLIKFNEVFGADIALFTIIHKWVKTYAMVRVEVEYILKSTKTNEVLYSRRGEILYDTAISGTGGAYGALFDLALTAANTIATKYVDVARICNLYTFKDLPSGKYKSDFGEDGDLKAGPKEFKAKLNAQYQ
ncbi:MAG: DUF799 family lipoprotein [Bacteroidia bacterium]|nr:DUF799 family lipoprotein [Bacteroidia bacterium]